MRLCLLAVLLSAAPLWSGALTITGGSPDADAPPRLVNAPARDTVVITLPGSAPETPVRPAPQPVEEMRAATPQSKPVLPPELQKDTATYLQRFIGIWKNADARALLGEPSHQRNAYDDDRSVNGQIYAFADPSGRYKEVELDFDSETSALRTVLVYPRNLTWQECRQRWAGPVSSADANNGRKFYSYENRKLDVLVDRDGKVISLGLY